MQRLKERLQTWWKQCPEWLEAKTQWLKEHWLKALLLVLLLWLLWWLYLLEKSEWVWLLENSESLRNLALIAAAVVGAVFIYWRNRIASTEAETKKENNLNSMYIFAIEQLGKEHEKGRPNLEVRIGALYSLEKLAQANVNYRQTIMDVLCSYVRNNAPLPKDPESPQENSSQYEKKPRSDIQTALTIIGRSNTESEESRPRVDLSNCYLVGANLEEADLQEAKLREANLQEARLRKAILVAAELQGANLQEANLQGANLQGANLQGANLIEANLQGTNLLGADLQKAYLMGADLQKATLPIADLRGCRYLKCAQLQKATNWQYAYRDPELACGAEIPDLPGKSEEEKRRVQDKLKKL